MIENELALTCRSCSSSVGGLRAQRPGCGCEWIHTAARGGCADYTNGSYYCEDLNSVKVNDTK